MPWTGHGNARRTDASRSYVYVLGHRLVGFVPSMQLMLHLPPELRAKARPQPAHELAIGSIALAS